MIRKMFVCAILFLAINPIVAFAGSTIRVGLDTPLTGAGQSPGHYLLWGAEIAVDEVNARGGVLGKKIELIVLDDETDPDKAVENIKTLVFKEKVPIVLGPVNSGNAIKFIPILQKEKIPNMLLVATATKLTKVFENEPKNYIFRSTLPDLEQIKVAVNNIVTKYKKIGIATDITGYGRFGRKNLIETIKSYGLEPVADVTFDLGDIDMTAQMKKMKESGAEAVAIYSLGAEIAHVVQSADQIDYHPVFFGPYTFFHHAISQLPTRISNGLLGVLNATVEDSETAKELDRLVRKKYVGDDYYPFTFVAVSYEGTKLMLEAIEKAKSLDGEKIRDTLENIEEFQGISRLFKKPYSKTDHELYNAKDMFVGVWKDGRVVRLAEQPPGR